MDHSPSFIGACKAVFEGIVINFCWPHLKRQGIEGHKSKFVNPGEHFEPFKERICQLHLATSKIQFDKLAELLSGLLIAQGETDVETWIRTQYFGEEFGHWFITAGYPTAVPNNNAEESGNRDAKRPTVGTGTKKQKKNDSEFFDSFLPDLVMDYSLQKGSDVPLAHVYHPKYACRDVLIEVCTHSVFSFFVTGVLTCSSDVCPSVP